MLVEMLYRRRDEYMPDMMSLDDVIDLAEKSDTPKPVILAEAADSPGAGASNLKQFEWKNIPKGIYPFDKQ